MVFFYTNTESYEAFINVSELLHVDYVVDVVQRTMENYDTIRQLTFEYKNGVKKSFLDEDADRIMHQWELFLIGQQIEQGE
jgi:hypothetical protein